MKRLLITGANSYIGMSLEAFLRQFPEEYFVETVDMIEDSWRQHSFSGYDAVFHVAGIAHQKETAENSHLYYKVNRDLVLETARKAKMEGVGEFIFLSSMSIYGIDAGVICRDTVPKPVSHYGKSKWEAEQLLRQLADDCFHVAILRPPMVYGHGCRGNFQTLLKIVQKFPVFPRVSNRRSMIHIDTLCAFVKLIIEKSPVSGVFFPQNREYMETSKIAGWASEAMGRHVYLSVLAGWAVMLLRPFSKKI